MERVADAASNGRHGNGAHANGRDGVLHGNVICHDRPHGSGAQKELCV